MELINQDERGKKRNKEKRKGTRQMAIETKEVASCGSEILGNMWELAKYIPQIKRIWKRGLLHHNGFF